MGKIFNIYSYSQIQKKLTFDLLKTKDQKPRADFNLHNEICSEIAILIYLNHRF